MTIALMPLPYAKAVLEPHISAETLTLHHGAHHKSYVEKTNAAIKGTTLKDASLNEIVRSAAAQKDQKLFNSAAQAWNHGFYWHSLSPDESKPSAALQSAIVRDFGSISALRAQLARDAEAHFASGWAWLVSKKGVLSIITTHDAETPLTGNATPLLVIDVWEHAYYLDHQNKRPDYLKGVVNALLNWDFASQNFKRDAVWQYPG
jgi:superoxide dismutase, Fe-Mn family